MICGNGDIAQAIKESGIDKEKITFFARGVSNSKEEREEEFEREKWELLNCRKDSHIVYFSSLCVYYSDTPYARHKKDMEILVSNYFNSTTIVRLGNISFGKNPNTIINYFKEKISRGEELSISNVHRHIVSKSEFIYWMGLIKPNVKDIMNITGELVYVPNLVEDIKNGKYGTI